MAATREVASPFATLGRLVAPLDLDEFLGGYYDRQVSMLAVIWTAWGANQADAAKIDAKTTGRFGIARGQTARINALCLPPGPFHAEMMFLDSMGNVVARSERREIAPGQATFFDFDATAFIIEGGRIELRAVVKGIGDPNLRQLNFTFEAFDNDTFKTTFFLPHESLDECSCGG